MTIEEIIERLTAIEKHVAEFSEQTAHVFLCLEDRLILLEKDVERMGSEVEHLASLQ